MLSIIYLEKFNIEWGQTDPKDNMRVKTIVVVSSLMELLTLIFSSNLVLLLISRYCWLKVLGNSKSLLKANKQLV